MTRLRQAADVSKPSHLFVDAGQALLHGTLQGQKDAVSTESHSVSQGHTTLTPSGQVSIQLFHRSLHSNTQNCWLVKQ